MVHKFIQSYGIIIFSKHYKFHKTKNHIFALFNTLYITYFLAQIYSKITSYEIKKL
jgi:hypothetical protein